MTWAIRDRYGMRGVEMGMEGKGEGALRHQIRKHKRQRKENPYRTNIHIHRGRETFSDSPTRIAHRMLAAPTGKIAAALSKRVRVLSLSSVTVIPGMWNGKQRMEQEKKKKKSKKRERERAGDGVASTGSGGYLVTNG